MPAPTGHRTPNDAVMHEHDEALDAKRVYIVGSAVSLGTGGGAGTPFNQYGEENAVVSTVETVVATYTVPGSVTAYISGALVTGSAAGRYKLKVNGTVKGMTRTSAASRAENISFGAGPVTCAAGDVITVTAYHEEVANQSMEANIYGYLT